MKEKIELYNYSYTIEKKELYAFQEAVFERQSCKKIPPTFSTVMDFCGGLSFFKLAELLFFDSSFVLHGSQSYEYIKPFTVGETIDATVSLISKTEKKGMTFAKLKTEYKRDGELVLVSRSTIIEQKGGRHV